MQIPSPYRIHSMDWEYYPSNSVSHKDDDTIYDNDDYDDCDKLSMLVMHCIITITPESNIYIL